MKCFEPEDFSFRIFKLNLTAIGPFALSVYCWLSNDNLYFKNWSISSMLLNQFLYNYCIIPLLSHWDLQRLKGILYFIMTMTYFFFFFMFIMLEVCQTNWSYQETRFCCTDFLRCFSISHFIGFCLCFCYFFCKIWVYFHSLFSSSLMWEVRLLVWVFFFNFANVGI